MNTAEKRKRCPVDRELSESLKLKTQRRKRTRKKKAAFVQFIRLHEIELTALIGLLAFNCTILTIICLMEYVNKFTIQLKQRCIRGLQLQCHWHSPECTRQRDKELGDYILLRHAI